MIIMTVRIITMMWVKIILGNFSKNMALDQGAPKGDKDKSKM